MLTKLEILDQIEQLSVVCRKCELRKNTQGHCGKFCNNNCLIGKELKSLGDELYQFKGTVRRILEKGDGMTKSEVDILVAKGVGSEVIREAMGLKFNEYINVMNGWGLLSKLRQVTA